MLLYYKIQRNARFIFLCLEVSGEQSSPLSTLSFIIEELLIEELLIEELLT